MKKLLLLLLLFSSSITAFASTELERVYLQQLLNQLNAMLPLVLAAQKEQPTNSRTSFHYTAFKDHQSQLHHGLLEDIKSIQQGIAEKLNGISLEPRRITPINGDYLFDSKNTKNKDAP